MRLLKFFIHHLKEYLEGALIALIMLTMASAILAAVFTSNLVTPLTIAACVLLAIYWIAAATGTLMNPIRYALQDWKDYREGKKNDKKK